jgi:hypothetical protein
VEENYNLPCEFENSSVQRGAVIQPLQSLDHRMHRSCRFIGRRKAGGRKPRRSECALRETPIEVNVSGRRADVLNRALNTSSDDIQRVDGTARVDDAAGASAGKCGDRSIDLKIAAALLVVQLDVPIRRKNSQHLQAIRTS